MAWHLGFGQQHPACPSQRVNVAEALGEERASGIPEGDWDPSRGGSGWPRLRLPPAQEPCWRGLPWSPLSTVGLSHSWAVEGSHKLFLSDSLGLALFVLVVLSMAAGQHCIWSVHWAGNCCGSGAGQPGRLMQLLEQQLCALGAANQGQSPGFPKPCSVRCFAWCSGLRPPVPRQCCPIKC